LEAGLVGAFAADFLMGTEFFLAAVAVFAADLTGAFLATFAGTAFFATGLLAVDLLAEVFFAGVFLAGVEFLVATYASFSARLPCSCNNKSPCQAKAQHGRHLDGVLQVYYRTVTLQN
jgi:hypothetical protein